MPAIFFAILVVSCAGSFTTKPSEQDSDAKVILSAEERKKLSMQLFVDKMQPVVASLKCPVCHTQAVGQNPFFADSNADIAFPAIGAKVNLDEIESSPILAKINAKHNCSSAGCDADAQAILEGLEAWQNGLSSAGATVKEHELETFRLFPNTDTVTNYNIGQLIDQQYREQFSLRITMTKQGQVNNSYQLNDLSIVINDNKQGVFVKGVKILVNGSSSNKTSQPFKNIACAVFYPSQSQSLSESTTNVVLNKDKDKLSFAFDEIRLANDDDTSCYSEGAMEKEFNSEIKPILEKNCGECHGSEAPAQQPDAPNFISFTEVKNQKFLLQGYLADEKEGHLGNNNIDNLSADDHNKIMSWLRALTEQEYNTK